MKTKILTLTFGLVSLMAVGCESTKTTNVNIKTANLANNTAIVVNSNTNTATTKKDRWNPKISKEEYEKDRAEYEKEKKGDTWGQSLEDSWLWFKVRSALMTTDDLRESTINVDVAKDVVTLKGTVESEAQKTKAEQVAKVDGVTKVVNQLKVAPNDSMTNTNTSDKSKNSNATPKK